MQTKKIHENAPIHHIPGSSLKKNTEFSACLHHFDDIVYLWQPSPEHRRSPNAPFLNMKDNKFPIYAMFFKCLICCNEPWLEKSELNIVYCIFGILSQGKRYILTRKL